MNRTQTKKLKELEKKNARLKKQWRLLLFGILSTVGTIIVTWLWNLIIHAN